MASSNNEYSNEAAGHLVGGRASRLRPSGIAQVTRVLKGHGHTDVGLVRKRNEDAFHVDAKLGFAVVADGMGGAPAGELASRLAVDAVVEGLTKSATEDHAHSPESLLAACQVALRAAEAAVTTEGRDNPVNKGLGCTLTLLMMDAERRHYAMAHVGDSRAYRVRGGVMEQLSRDHTLAQESVDEGRLPPDALRHHPFGHILTRVIGMEGTVEPQLETGPVHGGDQFLLCTDGVIRVLEEAEIESILAQNADLATSTSKIINDANDRGGPDNSTVVLLDVVANGG